NHHPLMIPIIKGLRAGCTTIEPTAPHPQRLHMDVEFPFPRSTLRTHASPAELSPKKVENLFDRCPTYHPGPHTPPGRKVEDVNELVYAWLGDSPVPYRQGWDLQKRLHKSR